MICSGCGVENPDLGNYCIHCGIDIKHDVLLGNIAYAGFWKRFLAILVDSIMIGIIESLMVFVIGGGINDKIIAVVLNWLYFTLFESSSKQATLGKMLLGILVTDLEGQRLTFGRANARYWTKIFSGLILGIGFMMAGFTQRKQALHDIIAETLVIKKRT